MRSIWVGFDGREGAAFAVCRHSIRRHLTQKIPISGLVLADLQAKGLYTRPTKIGITSDGHRKLIDVLSVRDDYDGGIATEHANARFLVPHLAHEGWALFMDGDMLARSNLARVFDGLDSKYAAYCVKHLHEPTYDTKMDGQAQTRYVRKNWTSFIIFNCSHAANRELTVEMVNTLPGRDLHRLCWLEDDLIGELGAEWNWLVRYSDPNIDPKVVHFTSGTPDMPGYENDLFADEWRNELKRWAA